MPEPLTIHGDEVVPLAKALEVSFGVDLAAGSGDPYRTLGELFGAVERRFEGAPAEGPSALDLALARTAEAVSAEAGRPVAPDERLDAVRPAGAQALLKAVEARTGLGGLAPELSRVGGLGCLLMAAGLLAPAALVFVSPWGWTALALLPIGGMIVRADPGQFGDLTLSDLARQLRDLNYAALVEAGAGYRADEAWEALTGLLAAKADEGAGCELTRDTPFA